MFMALDEQELEVVIDAMDEKKVSAGTNVIVEGANGDELYVVEEGKLDCFKKFVMIICLIIFFIYSLKIQNRDTSKPTNLEKHLVNLHSCIMLQEQPQ